MRLLAFLAFLLAMFGWVIGCGGGGGGTSQPTQTTGTAVFQLDWPSRARALPVDAESVKVQVLSGGSVISEQMTNRPAAAGSTQLTFASLPEGALQYTAFAYSQAQCAGIPLGTINAPLQITAGQITREVLSIDARPRVTGVILAVPKTELTVDDSTTITATAVDQQGQPVLATLAWTNQSPGVVSLSGTGHITALSPGTSRITVSVQGTTISNYVTITVVRKPPVLSVTVTPTTASVQIGKTVQLSARLQDDTSQTLSGSFRWETSDAGVATVDARGLVRGIAVGSAEITATDSGSGKSAKATVRVTTPPPPGGTGRIVFYSGTVDSEDDSSNELYLIGGDGSGLRQLTTNTYSDFDPVFSADGQRIAFVSNRTGTKQIFLMHPDGSEVQQVTHASAGAVDPAFGPDGNTLYYSSDGNIYRMDIASKAVETITSSGFIDRHPSVSRDGRKIVFSSTRNGAGRDNYNIFLMNADGSDIQQLTESSYWEGHPLFSPDDMKIAFYSNRASDHTAYQTFFMTPSGDAETRLLEVSHCSRQPSFSPDGQWLAFAANPDKNFDIYIARADGSQFTLLYADTGRAMHPFWGP